MRCPKCNATSGNDWSCPGKSCPMPGSPHYQTNKVTEAAIRQPDGVVWSGTRHHHIIRAIVERTGVRPVVGDQGFITDTGWFVDRDLARLIVLAERQLVSTPNPTDLFSEDCPWLHAQIILVQRHCGCGGVMLDGACSCCGPPEKTGETCSCGGDVVMIYDGSDTNSYGKTWWKECVRCGNLPKQKTDNDRHQG